MKKTIKITIPERVEERAEYFCDICGKEIGTYIRHCTICKRDVCGSCRNSDPNDYSDCPDYYCSKCYELKFKKYSEERERIEDQYDYNVEQLNEKIRLESLGNEDKKDT